MKGIEEQLRGSELHKEVLALQRKLELLAEEKREHEERCSTAKVEAKDLKFTGEWHSRIGGLHTVAVHDPSRE